MELNQMSVHALSERVQELEQQLAAKDAELARVRSALARLDLMYFTDFSDDTERPQWLRDALASPAAEPAPANEPVDKNPAIAAIQYVLDHPTDDAIEFLRAWFEGDFSSLRNLWEDVPETVFIGADPFYKPAPVAQSEQENQQ